MTATQETVELSQRFRLVFSAPSIQALDVEVRVKLRNAVVEAKRWDDISDTHQELLLTAEAEVSRWR